MSTLRCAIRRDALAAAAALARSFVDAGGSSSGDESTRPPRPPRPTRPTRPPRAENETPRARAKAPIRDRLDRVDPDAFAFAAKPKPERSPPRGAPETLLIATRPGVIERYYGPDPDPGTRRGLVPSSPARERSTESDRPDASAGSRVPRGVSLAPRPGAENKDKTAKSVSVVGGETVAFSPSFSAPALATRVRDVPFAKPASVRRAAARTMRASSLGLGAQMADSQTADSTFLTRSVARSTMPTARWFDGAAPAMASSRRDASSPEMAPDVRDATGTGRVTETETDVAAFDAFRVPDVTGVRPDDETTPAKATKRTNAACVSATVVEVARATLALRPGLEWCAGSGSEASDAKDNDCDGVRVAFAEASLRADAYEDVEDASTSADETDFSASALSVARVVTAALGDAAVFTRTGAQNAPATTRTATPRAS